MMLAKKKLLIVLILIIGCSPYRHLCLDKQLLLHNFNILKPHKNVLNTKEDEQWSEFIKSNTDWSPHQTLNKVVKEFFPEINTSRKAVNFGSGSGREDIYLIKRGWEVLSIDASIYSGRLISEKSRGSNGKSIFFHGKFTDAKLEGQYDLIMSFYSLPFDKKSNIIHLMEDIANHLKPGGILLVNFFGYDHDFVKNNIAYGISQAELFSLLLLNKFKIIAFEDKTYKKKNNSTWEILEVVAFKL